ncbi:MAG: hypothetical protein RL114_369 [Actinomycetota bacterium]|jgi:predicted DNA-binding protein (UPF0251 family)
MKNSRKALTATSVAVLLSLGATNTVASAATDTTTTIPSTITVSRKHVLNTDKIIASELGISVSQLRSELAAGSTLAEVAANHGSSAASLTAVIKAKLAALVTKAVKAGSVGRSRAASLRATLGATVSGLMNRAVATSRHGDNSELQLLSDTVVANLLGITVDALRTELKTGISILTAATNRGVTQDALVAALTTDATTKINAAVTAGTITQAKGDELLASLATRISGYINRIQTPTQRRKGPEKREQKKFELSSPDVVARILGITKEALKAESENGLSFAQIAVNYNVTVDTLKAGITADATSRIAAALASGRITQTQADAYTASLATWVDTFINRIPKVEVRVGKFRLVSIDAAATFIGVTKDALKVELLTGISIAQSAINHGKTVDDLSAALTTDSTTRVNALVTSGLITQTKAAALLASLPQAIATFINQIHTA